jgi:hypothetical protein
LAKSAAALIEALETPGKRKSWRRCQAHKEEGYFSPFFDRGGRCCQAMETDAAALAAAMAVIWYDRRRNTREREKEYRPPYEYIRHSFSLELMPPGRARIYLRFKPEEIYRLVPLLGLEGVPFRSRYTADPMTAFCVVAARLSFPGRWEPLCDLFGRSKSWLSTVFNDVILFLVARFGPLLLWHPQLT